MKKLQQVFGMPLETLQSFASDVRAMESSVKGDRVIKKKHGAVPIADDELDADDESEDEDR